jgi:hypothetical protein
MEDILIEKVRKCTFTSAQLTVAMEYMILNNHEERMAIRRQATIKNSDLHQLSLVAFVYEKFEKWLHMFSKLIGRRSYDMNESESSDDTEETCDV